MATRKGGRPPKADGTKHVRPSMTWSPSVDELARRLRDHLAKERGEAMSLGEVAALGIALLAQEEGLL